MALKALALASLVVCFVIPHGSAAQDAESVTRLVDVDGQVTRVRTFGLDERTPGHPVVVLQAGAGGSIGSWGRWATQVAESASVIAYDRVGIGQSPYDDEVPTIERVNEHLHRLLGVLDVPPPYVLVGHSWGGPLNLFYAASFPDDVRGLVHLDPPDPRLTPLEYLAASSEAELGERWAEWDAYFAEDELTPGLRAEDEYINGFYRTPVEERDVPPDPRVPTAFVFGMMAPEVGDDWLSYGEEMMASTFRLRLERVVPSMGQRTNGAVFLSGDSGHMVHLDDPALSLYAVQHVLARVPFPVERRVMESFVGDYRREPGPRISVGLTDDGLTFRVEDQAATFLRAVSETLYRVGVGAVTIEFLRDDDAVTALVVHQRGSEDVFPRVRD